MLTAGELRAMSRAELMEVMCAGHAIDARALDDTEYRGVSLGLPRAIERATWTKFFKVFCRDGAALRGWNMRAEDNGLDAPWIPKRKRGQPITFGHFVVVPARGRRMPRPCDAGLLIDYGTLVRVRDPIVAVNAGSVDLLLGWSYVDLGVRQVPTPSFFSLQRGGPITHLVRPPRVK